MEKYYKILPWEYKTVLTHCFYCNTTGSSSQSHKSRKGNKSHKYWKWRSKTIIHSWHDCIYTNSTELKKKRQEPSPGNAMTQCQYT